MDNQFRTSDETSGTRHLEYELDQVERPIPGYQRILLSDMDHDRSSVESPRNIAAKDIDSTPQEEMASPKRRPPKLPWWQKLPWTIEVLAWIGALIFFIGIIIALKSFDGKPLPELKFGVSPGAIISLLATFFEGLLMTSVSSSIGQLKWTRVLTPRSLLEFHYVDEVSRGSWGSLTALVRMKGGCVRFSNQ